MSSIGSTLSTIATSLLNEISSYKSQKNTNTAAASAGTSTAVSDQVSVSQGAELFQELQQLQKSDPTEFKQILSDAASKLKAAASQTTDTNQAGFLNNLATRFQNAATTGDLSALKPTGGNGSGSGYASHGHHHHGGGGGGANLQTLLSTILANNSSTNSNSSSTGSTGTGSQTQPSSQVQNLLAGIGSL